MNSYLKTGANMDYRNKVEWLLADPERLKQKKPFTRGIQGSGATLPSVFEACADLNETVSARLPRIKRLVVSQEQYLAELDPESHKVLYDQNIPCITMKLNDGGYATIEYKKMSIPFQRIIKDKQLLHLCGNSMQLTLINEDPTEAMTEDFALFKQAWAERNQDGMRTKMVDAQLSCGDAGLLYYFDKNGRVKCRLLSFMEGYVLCPHNDDNGDRILESVYYEEDGIEYIDSYDDTYMYRWRSAGPDEDSQIGWTMEAPVRHGFSEIPLVTKRGPVAWDNVQNVIEVYEVIYNIFMVIQKRHGWGILYIRGRFEEDGRQIAGSIILNDTSLGQTQGDAKYLSAPDPQGMFDTLQSLEESIQKGSSTTFLLPKDVKTSGDISGIAIQLMQSLDDVKARRGVIEWQNVASKMCRLFKEGLAKELVNSGDASRENAVTDFARMNISAKFKTWMPRSENEYNNMLGAMKSSGILSAKTAIQKNTESTPDEEIRMKRETEEAARRQVEFARAQNGITPAGEQPSGESGANGNDSDTNS